VQRNHGPATNHDPVVHSCSTVLRVRSHHPAVYRHYPDCRRLSILEVRALRLRHLGGMATAERHRQLRRDHRRPAWCVPQRGTTRNREFHRQKTAITGIRRGVLTVMGRRNLLQWRNLNDLAKALRDRSQGGRHVLMYLPVTSTGRTTASSLFGCEVTVSTPPGVTITLRRCCKWG
jgi:hypothetical protein